MIIKRTITVLSILFIAVFLFACSTEEDQGAVIAIVNGEEVYEKPLQRMVDDMKFMYEKQGISFDGEQGEMFLDMLKDQALEQLIQQTVIIQTADSYDLLATDEEVDNELQQIIASFDNEEAYQNALDFNNLTESDLRESIFENLTMRHLVSYKMGEVDVSDEDVLSYYEEYVEQTEKQKAEILEEQDELTEEQEAMFDIPDFEEVKSRIKEMLINEKQQEMAQLIIDELVEQSDIEILQ